MTSRSALKRPSVWWRRFVTVLPPLLLFLLVGVAWEAIVHLRDIPRFLLPAPSVIIARIITDWQSLVTNSTVTLMAASAGFLIGTTAAILLSISFLFSKSFERAFFPWAIIIKTVPILAIAPLLTIWLGFGIAPKIAIAAIACFFPTLVNVTRGLRSVDKSVLDFMAVVHADPLKLLRHARLFAALPYLFSAMKITVGMSMIGAIIAEFTGANQGIGTIIVNAGYRQDAVMLFSAIFVTSFATIVFFYCVILLEKLALFWPEANIDDQ